MHLQRQKAIGRAVFVHGAGGGGWEWAIWERVFCASGWDTLAPDLAPAAAGLAATRLHEYVDQVGAWCDAGARTFVLIGASLGGLLALVAAARALPAALVLINPIPPASDAISISHKDYPNVVPWGRERSLIGTRLALPDADDAACLYAFRRWRDESGAVMREAVAGVPVEVPQCPLLLLASETDADVPAVITRTLADAWQVEFRLLRGASHVGPLLGRDAAAIAGQTLAWLEQTLNVTR